MNDMDALCILEKNETTSLFFVLNHNLIKNDDFLIKYSDFDLSEEFDVIRSIN